MTNPGWLSHRRMKMGRVEGKVALVTGGALGIGRADAEALAREGAKIGIADRDDEAGKQTVAKLQQAGFKAIFVKLDVSSEPQWKEAMDTVVKEFGGLHILVNNAGIYLSGTTENTPLDVWDSTFAVNVKGVFLGSKTAIPVMRSSGGGSIINMCSNWGLVGFPDAAAYGGRGLGAAMLDRLGAMRGPARVTATSSFGSPRRKGGRDASGERRGEVRRP